jgi:hypothetical protein
MKQAFKNIVGAVLGVPVLGTLLGRFVEHALYCRKSVPVCYDDDRAGMFERFYHLRRVPGKLPGVTVPEAILLLQAAEATAKVPGDMAEVGVYTGGTARIICEAASGRTVRLFDTFQGLRDVSEVDVDGARGLFRNGEYASQRCVVEEALRGLDNFRIHEGYFPGSAAGLEELRFSFAHLDVDTYQSTLGCLGWFYPRMNPGGVIVSHDYANAAGVKKAFTEFFADKPEPVIGLACSQCLVVKV